MNAPKKSPSMRSTSPGLEECRKKTSGGLKAPSPARNRVKDICKRQQSVCIKYDYHHFIEPHTLSKVFKCMGRTWDKVRQTWRRSTVFTLHGKMEHGKKSFHTTWKKGSGGERFSPPSRRARVRAHCKMPATCNFAIMLLPAYLCRNPYLIPHASPYHLSDITERSSYL